MRFWIKCITATVLFVISWVAVGSGMEAIGIEIKPAYSAFGAIWGMLWVGVLSVISD